MPFVKPKQGNTVEVSFIGEVTKIVKVLDDDIDYVMVSNKDEYAWVVTNHIYPVQGLEHTYEFKKTP